MLHTRKSDLHQDVRTLHAAACTCTLILMLNCTGRTAGHPVKTAGCCSREQLELALQCTAIWVKGLIASLSQSTFKLPHPHCQGAETQDAHQNLLYSLVSSNHRYHECCLRHCHRLCWLSSCRLGSDLHSQRMSTGVLVAHYSYNYNYLV